MENVLIQLRFESRYERRSFAQYLHQRLDGKQYFDESSLQTECLIIQRSNHKPNFTLI